MGLLIYLGNLTVQTLSCEFCWYLGLNACPGKILRIRPTEIEFESNFSSIIITAFNIRCPLSTVPLIWELNSLRLNVRQFITIVNHWKFLRIIPSKIKCQSNFSKFIFTSYVPFRLMEILRIRSLRLNLGVISAAITVSLFRNSHYCWKFLRIRPTEIECKNDFSNFISV